MIKLIAIDADGTLLNSSSKISKANQAAINKCIQMGLKVVLITGKNLKSARRIIDALSPPNPHVVSNGTLIVDHNLQHLDYRLVDPASFKAIVKFARKTGQLLLASTLDGDLLYEKTLKGIEHKHYMRKVEDLLAQEVTSQVLLATILRGQGCEPIKYHHIAPDKKGIKIRDAGFNYVNIFNRQAGKTFALKKVLGYLNLDSSQVMAIGDGQNDLGIITMAGIGVAMGNACSQLKKAADFVTEDLDHDGVSKALSRVLGI